MKLDLYTTGVSRTRLSGWVADVSEVAQAEGIKVISSPIPETPATLQEKFSVVLDELCSIPDQRTEFHGTDEASLCTFAYKRYRARLDAGWNVSLYSPSKEAIFLHFDERLLATRAAHLYYQEGNSDKVYHLYLAQALTVDFYSVISRYGRRGRNLQQTEKVFDYQLHEAEREWNRLHHAKIQKGYQIGHPTPSEQLELELPF
ncbi:MAG: WGR domain-containing protein [Candidatus Poribacteria bacterium]|nr:WGR domain-containing protein [Candidatus Poribacteria bacterium]